jgi:hypothetical protein
LNEVIKLAPCLQVFVTFPSVYFLLPPTMFLLVL